MIPTTEERPHLGVVLTRENGGYRVHLMRLSNADIKKRRAQTLEPEVLSLALSRAMDELTDELTK